MNLINKSLISIVFFGFVASNSYAEKIILYTEEFPPFNMTEKGKITGVSTEVVQAVMKNAGISYKIQSYPWARTYKLAQKGKNSFIYSISRRTKREKLFKWIGIIVPTVQSVFSLKERDIIIKKLDDMKQYSIGTTREDARETFLVNKGFDIKNFQRTSGDDSYFNNYKKLKVGRIDLWPMPDAVAFHFVKKAGDNPGKMIKKVFTFEEMSKGGYYLAASLSVPDNTVNKIRKSLEDFKATTDYKKILGNWGL